MGKVYREGQLETTNRLKARDGLFTGADRNGADLVATIAQAGDDRTQLDGCPFAHVLALLRLTNGQLGGA
jgi:hypothetical protein